MNVHNIMEEIVFQTVNKIYDELKEENTPWLSCDCENCRIDTVSYVLNHIPPKYIVSGRGATHSAELLSDSQIKADIEATTLEGCRIVSTTKRPFHSAENKTADIGMSTPVFNFPTFSGTILDGSNFEPVIGANVLLKMDGKEVPMIDKTFSNPIATCQGTKGAFTFWANPIPADSVGISKKFTFTLEVTAKDYDPVTLSFDVTITSDETAKKQLDSTFSIKKDIVIFNKEIENTMDF